MKGTVISPSNCTGQFDSYDKPADLTELEVEALNIIESEFEKNNENFTALRFVRRSQDYLTILSPNNFDFCRIKVTSRSVWFSINGKLLPPRLQDDARFAEVNKKLIHWKLKLVDVSEFEAVSDLIFADYIGAKNVT